MKEGITILFFVFISFCLKAQSQNDSTLQFTTDSHLLQDKRVNELILKHIQINKAEKGKTAGYRVQIHFSVEKAKALDVKSKFTKEYPAIPIYLDYEQPYFKIRVGDFRTKLEAYKLLKNISSDFPGGFIVDDDITPPNL